ncbi:hypothetical protein F2Q69_00027372 [Brassica cretica]|uniref:Uncharacterized protein n=1 Tax=Brassica cretica TaxID=69181 RepID=A0A8S9S5C1_BRACR|nr:hypothetical protein F2Q69_00027372 [Brassica cretica]
MDDDFASGDHQSLDGNQTRDEHGLRARSFLYSRQEVRPILDSVIQSVREARWWLNQRLRLVMLRQLDVKESRQRSYEDWSLEREREDRDLFGERERERFRRHSRPFSNRVQVPSFIVVLMDRGKQKQLIIYKIINNRSISSLKQLVSCFSVTSRGTAREGLHISRYGIGQLVSGPHPARDGPAVYRQKTNPQRFGTGRDGRAQLPSLVRTMD